MRSPPRSSPVPGAHSAAGISARTRTHVRAAARAPARGPARGTAARRTWLATPATGTHKQPARGAARRPGQHRPRRLLRWPRPAVARACRARRPSVEHATALHAARTAGSGWPGRAGRGAERQTRSRPPAGGVARPRRCRDVGRWQSEHRAIAADAEVARQRASVVQRACVCACARAKRRVRTRRAPTCAHVLRPVGCSPHTAPRACLHVIQTAATWPAHACACACLERRDVPMRRDPRPTDRAGGRPASRGPVGRASCSCCRRRRRRCCWPKRAPAPAHQQSAPPSAQRR